MQAGAEAALAAGAQATAERSLVANGHLTPPGATAGWRVGEPVNRLTAKGERPAWDTVRERVWKNEAALNADRYDPEELDRMRQGLAPQRVNPSTGELESMELHHNPSQRDGGLVDVEKVFPDEHATVDPFRRTGTGQ